MSERKVIRNYLLTLRGYLSPLSKLEADDVVREIESHIYDVIDEQEMKGQKIEVEALLKRLGPPQTLADKYVSHVQTGTPPPSGFRALNRVTRSISVTSYYTLFVVGFGVSILLVALACANLFLADGIAIWSEAGGNSIVIGSAEEAMGKADDEVFSGFWISPLALLASYLTFRMTYRILKVVKGISTEQSNA